MKQINLMPMLIKIVELDFSWPLFNSGLYWVALRYTVAGTVNEFHTDFPPCISIQLLNIKLSLKCQ